MSRNEQLLETIINGENLEDFKPLSRNEQILFNCVNKKGLEGLPAPLSRSEALLQGLSNMIKSGLGSGRGSGDAVSNNASLNVSYCATPPSDITKVWIATNEPESVEIQTEDIPADEYLVSEVKNYGDIDTPNTETSTNFYNGLYGSCYMEDYKIILVGSGHVFIYDLEKKIYTLDLDLTSYKMFSGNISSIIYRDNIIYFVSYSEMYSVNLKTKELVDLGFPKDYPNGDGYFISISYIFFNGDDKIDCLCSFSSANYLYRYKISTGEFTQIKTINRDYFKLGYMTHNNPNSSIIVGKYLYNFNCDTITTDNIHYMKYNLNTENVEEFTSLKDFVTNTLGVPTFAGTSAVYDGKRFIYLIGGGRYYNREYTGYRNITKYDTLNDSFEILEYKSLGYKYMCFSYLINNRVYMFGSYVGSNNIGTRVNKIDYFDIYYPLTENNAIIVINPEKVDNAYKLIDSENLKLYKNLENAYIGNSENKAKQVDIYKYNIISSTNDCYSSITFDKNSIINNFDTIVNRISSTGSGGLSVTFGGDSESFKYSMFISVMEDHIVGAIANNSFEFATMFAITSNGTLEEIYMDTPCTWTSGDSTTLTFDSNLEVNTLANAFGGDLVTPQVLIDLGICTFEFVKGEVIGKWAGINCENYDDSVTGGE